jgi:hypothetical protein
LKDGEKPNGEVTLEECEVRTQGEPQEESDTPKGEYTGEQTPHKPHLELRPHIKIYLNDKPYEIVIKSTDAYSKDDPRFTSDIDHTNHIITLWINENRQDLKPLDVHQRFPLYVEWIVEVMVHILQPSLSSEDFTEEREKRLSLIDIDGWYAELKERLQDQTP